MQANPPAGMPPDVAGSMGAMQGLAAAGTGLAQQAAARGVNIPPPPGGPPSPPPVPSSLGVNGRLGQ
jgi:hypothetical protein